MCMKLFSAVPIPCLKAFSISEMKMRSNPQFRVFGHVDVDLYLGSLRNADFHKIDIAVDKLNLIVESDEVLLVIVEDMPEHTAEFQYRLLCFLLVEGCEGIDVVEGVEQEMRIDLIPQVLQLCILFCHLCFPTCRF